MKTRTPAQKVAQKARTEANKLRKKNKVKKIDVGLEKRREARLKRKEIKRQKFYAKTKLVN